MRGFFAAVEQGFPVVCLAELDPPLAPEDLAALRDAGVLRDEGRDGLEEVSAPDLARALRALYGIEGRGLPVPAKLGRGTHVLGWCKDGDADREVYLLTGPSPFLNMAILGLRRSLLLVPTARLVSAEERAKHAAGAFVVIDVLAESVTVRDGRLARAGVRAPSAPDLSALSPVPAPPPALPAALSSAPPPASRLIAGASRWNEIRISLIDATTVRIELPGVSVHRTYVDLGMAHSKNRQPRRVWELLVELCEGHGIFLSTRFGSGDATKKLVSRLGGELGAIFGLEDSAFHPYRPTEGWQTRFQASPRIGRDA
jgi:hypothetical protein